MRAGNLFGYANLISDLGGDAASAFSSVGETADILHDPNLRISYQLANALLIEGCRTTGRSDFALRLSSRQGPHILGAVSELLETASTVKDALQSLNAYFALHNGGASAKLETYDEYAVWSLTVEVAEVEAWHHADLGAGMAMRILRHLIDDHWRPLTVMLAHRQPDDIRFYKQTFLAPVEFNREMNALVISRADLESRPQTADAARFDVLLHEARKRLNNHQPDIEARVSRMVFETMSNCAAKAETVADRLGMTLRGMQRELQAAGLTFRSILTSARMDLASRYLLETDIPINQLADLLDYSDQTAFSRAFGKAFVGQTPAAWRRRKRRAHADLRTD